MGRDGLWVAVVLALVLGSCGKAADAGENAAVAGAGASGAAGAGSGGVGGDVAQPSAAGASGGPAGAGSGGTSAAGSGASGHAGQPAGGGMGDDAAGAGGAGADGSAGSAGTEVSGPWPPSDTFGNPVLWEDLADLDVFRVDDTFYYMASNMHYSPGAPILRSFDLVNWEYAGHAVPVLDFSAAYDLNGGQAYVKGTWASFLNYRASNQTFYFGACIEFNKTYIYTAPAVEGPWEKHPAINNCYYDAGLLIDDDDTLYVAFGNTQISVAELSADGLSQVRAQQVFSTPGNIGTLEGSRFYKIDGNYYIFVTRPPDGQFILKSSDPFGPYEVRNLVDRIGSPIQGGGSPHQGGLVQLENGDWYYMAFVDAYPGGRVPVLAPVSWNAEGWPELERVDGRWGVTYPYPDVPRPPRAIGPRTGVDRFEGTELSQEWEWNHNPDNAKWSLNEGLRLETATRTDDLYRARNTLTHRILGPMSTATIELDFGAMHDGDRAGLALLRNASAFIGVKKSGATTTLVMVNGLAMDGSWNTTSTGTEAASAPLSGDTVFLRVAADIRPGPNGKGRFSYSSDGVEFTPLGSDFTMNNSWQFFMGYRYAIFNYATVATGGSVTVRSFEVSAP
jgi:beta-xylosidase